MTDDLFYINEYKELQSIQLSVNRAKTLYFYGAGLRCEEILQMQRWFFFSKKT